MDKKRFVVSKVMNFYNTAFMPIKPKIRYIAYAGKLRVNATQCATSCDECCSSSEDWRLTSEEVVSNCRATINVFDCLFLNLQLH